MLIPLATRLASHRQKDLRSIAAFLRLPQPGQRYDNRWCEQVAQGWQDEAQRRRWWSLLSPAAQAACVRLLAAGTLPAGLFFGEYGSLRTTTTRHPSPNASEELFYAGLLHAAQPAPIHTATDLVTAHELHAPLQSLLNASHLCKDEEREMQPASTTVPSLLLDLVQWLAYLYPQPPTTLLHGRWLPRANLTEFNQRLKMPLAAEALARHAQIPTLARLAWWSAAAGLVDGGHLTPVAWHWLADDPPAQLHLLWQAWLRADTGLRRAYHQPPTPSSLWTTLLSTSLLRLPSSFGITELSHQLLALGQAELGDALDPFLRAHFDSLSALDRQVAQALEELGELGMVQQTSAHLGVAAHQGQTPCFALTPLGRWLLTPALQPPPAWEWQRTGLQMEKISTAEPLWQVRVPALFAPDRLLQLAAFADFSGRSTEAAATEGAYSLYTLTPQRFGRAAAAGLSLANLWATLAHLHLAPAQVTTLQHWFAGAGEVELALYPLLRAKEPKLLAQIAHNPTLRPLLGEWLSPTVASWTGDPRRVAKRLEEAGYRVHNRLASPSQDKTQPSATGQRGELWLAGQLYIFMGNYLPLPMPIDNHLLQAFFAQLPLAEQTALGALWRQFEQQLLTLLDHQPFVPPPTPSDPTHWLAHLNTAIEHAYELEILYFSAGRNLLTQRWVQPYHLFAQEGIEQGDARYLRAYCHAMGAVLTFRLDRIHAILNQRQAAMPAHA